jgi:alpha-L-fucosidase
MNEIFSDIESQNQFAAHTGEDTYTPPKDKSVIENLKKWQSGKFGIIIHMGLYSQLGICESWELCPEDEDWITREGYDDYDEYKKYYKNSISQFNPSKLNSKKWAKAIKDAGAKYVIFTTKHHDGFCLFDSKYTDFKITSEKCPYSTNKNADLLKDVFDSFRNEGLKIGAYYSKPDWNSDYFWWKYFPPKDRNPNYDITKHPDRWNKFIEFSHNQLNEITSNYGNIDILWLDGCWVRPFSTINEKVKEFCKYPHDLDINMKKISEITRKNQPGLIIVDRWVQGEYENYLTPERKTPDEALLVPWESCITMGNAWGWVPNEKFKSARELIQLLVKIIAGGGNLLLGIGPNGQGEFQHEVYDRLEKIGQWLKINQEAVYGSSPVFPFQQGKIAYTANNNSVYAFYLPDLEEKSAPSEIFLDIKLNSAAYIRLLGTDVNLELVKTKTGFKIILTDILKEKLKNLDVITFKLSNL